MNRWLQRLFAALVYGFLYLPLVVVAIFSFNNSKYPSPGMDSPSSGTANSGRTAA
jgi:ABC-type spermidine/putrescine transport system permease subunit II